MSRLSDRKTSRASTSSQHTDVDGIQNNKTAETEDHLNSLVISRAAATYFDRFSIDELQELLIHTNFDWLLSIDDSKSTHHLPIDSLQRYSALETCSEVVVLIPLEDELETVELREVHQIIRDLVVGMYIFNTTPSLNLHVNHDLSCWCKMPPAYHDTRLGQLMIEVDYTIKSLWHGVYFAREKRSKMAERWKQGVNFNPMTGESETKRNMLHLWQEAGQTDMCGELGFDDCYDGLNKSIEEIDLNGDLRALLSKHINDLNMCLTFSMCKVDFRHNVFMASSQYLVNDGLVSSNLSIDTYEQLQRILVLHKQFITDNLKYKDNLKHQILMLHLVNFLIPLLTALKKVNRIPNTQTLLPPYSYEESKTDRELPPIVIDDYLACKNFKASPHYQSLHGGVRFNRQTPVLREFRQDDAFDDMLRCVMQAHNKLTNLSHRFDSYPVKTVKYAGKRFLGFVIELQPYFPISPKTPPWLHAYLKEFERLNLKKLPMTDAQINDQLRKRVGYAKMGQIKQKNLLLQTAAEQGLLALSYTLSRKIQSTKLNAINSDGLALVHYAAIYNHPQIISQLVTLGCDVNIRKSNQVLPLGVTPVILASKCGSLDSLVCLVFYRASLRLFDSLGYNAVHYAATFNNLECLKFLLQQEPLLIEAETRDSLYRSPLLLAAISGSFDCVKYLLKHRANRQKRDYNDCGVIQLSALHSHTIILEFLLEKKFNHLDVLPALIQMLQTDDSNYKQKSARCLQTLTLPSKGNWRQVLEAGGIPVLVDNLAGDDDVVTALAASVLCNIGEHAEVRAELGAVGAVEKLMQLLQSPHSLIHSRAAVVVADLACVNEFQVKIAEEGMGRALWVSNMI